MLINKVKKLLFSLQSCDDIDDDELLRYLEEIVIMIRNEIRIKQNSPIVLKTPNTSKDILITDVRINDCEIEFTLNTLLPHRSITSNQYIRDVVYDVIINNRKSLKLLRNEKILIIITEHCKPTHWGYLNRDTDNSDRKGIIDAVATGLGIDDSGGIIASLADACKLEQGEKPYTHIRVCRFNDVIKN